MLQSLSIRDIVLIDRLDLDFRPGLNVLTGETGAGKSILMDALGFALGRKVRRDLVRSGAGQGTVTAEFVLSDRHPALAEMEELGLSDGTGTVILRRIAAEAGPSRAFVNDQRVSAETLDRIGACLVEVHGQHDDRGLLYARGHMALLDAYGGLGGKTDMVRDAWGTWQRAEAELLAARDEIARAAADADFLRHSVEELDKLAPRPGEDAELDTERRLIRSAVDLTDEIVRARDALSGEGAEGALADALSRLTHIAGKAEGRLEAAIGAIDRTMAELTGAQDAVEEMLEALRFDPGRLEAVEERLFAIRGLARKHNVQPDELEDLGRDFAARLEAIDAGEGRLADLEAALERARVAFASAAADLGKARRQAGAALDGAVTAELAPLKMENARFVTEIREAQPGPSGTDAVRFTAAINAGAAAGPIDRIASGGELARFLLALKVQLAARSDGLTMIFDEIDRGVGGATADAVGRRLQKLAASGQVLVVTHSPQVAALGARHYLIAKSTRGKVARTEVNVLDDAGRRDEIARMLAGDRVTDAARDAAGALLADAER